MSDNKDLTPIDPKLQDSPDGRIMDEIAETVMSMESKTFDPHLFLLYHAIFREASSNPQILDYVAQLPPKDLDKYRDTVYYFHEFWGQFIKTSVGPVSKNIEGDDKIAKLVTLFIDYNDATQESRFKMPQISHSKKDWWGIIHDKLRIGRAKRLKK